MKTNIYRPVLIRVLLFILISLYFLTVFGQSITAESKNKFLPAKSSNESIALNYATGISTIVLTAIPTVLNPIDGERVVLISFYTQTPRKHYAKKPGYLFPAEYCYLPFVRNQ